MPHPPQLLLLLFNLTAFLNFAFPLPHDICLQMKNSKNQGIFLHPNPKVPNKRAKYFIYQINLIIFWPNSIIKINIRIYFNETSEVRSEQTFIGLQNPCLLRNDSRYLLAKFVILYMLEKVQFGGMWHPCHQVLKKNDAFLLETRKLIFSLARNTKASSVEVLTWNNNFKLYCLTLKKIERHPFINF